MSWCWRRVLKNRSSFNAKGAIRSGSTFGAELSAYLPCKKNILSAHVLEHSSLILALDSELTFGFNDFGKRSTRTFRLSGMDTDSTRQQAAPGLNRAFFPSTKERNLSPFKSPKHAASLRSTLTSTGKPFRPQQMDECSRNMTHLTQEPNGL